MVQKDTSTELTKELGRTSSTKKMKTVVATAFVLGLVAVGTQSAFADQIQNTSTNSTSNIQRENPMTEVVSAIATKFNLNTADVQTVVDGVMQKHRTSMEVKMQSDASARLAAAVTAGKLTQAQADLITAKAAELKATMQSEQAANKTLTPEQRKAKMDEQRTSLEAWVTANGISKENLKFLAPAGRGPGMGAFGPNGEHKGFGSKGFNHKASSTSGTTQ